MPESHELNQAELQQQMDEVRRQLRQQLSVAGESPPDGPAAPAPRQAAAGPTLPPGPPAKSDAGEALQPAVGPAGGSIALQPGAERRIAIGADHGGYELKCRLIELLQELGFESLDVGTDGVGSVDYPDFAVKVARAVARGEAVRGVMIDGAGIGSAMAANKIAGVRAATCHNEATVINSREHNNANVLVLGSGQVNRGLARRMLRIWLSIDFAGGRHARRVAKIDALDQA